MHQHHFLWVIALTDDRQRQNERQRSYIDDEPREEPKPVIDEPGLSSKCMSLQLLNLSYPLKF